MSSVIATRAGNVVRVESKKSESQGRPYSIIRPKPAKAKKAPAGATVFMAAGLLEVLEGAWGLLVEVFSTWVLVTKVLPSEVTVVSTLEVAVVTEADPDWDSEGLALPLLLAPLVLKRVDWPMVEVMEEPSDSMVVTMAEVLMGMGTPPKMVVLPTAEVRVDPSEVMVLRISDVVMAL